jgi:creatinine amidohydrolase
MRLEDMTWAEVDALSRDVPMVFPVAALEQHGRHLPLFTDSLLLGEIVRRASVPLGDRVVFAPVTWLGSSDHHLDFPGTLSAAPRVYLDLLNGLLENVIRHGFRRLVLLNGHGGNIVPMQQAIFETRQRHRDRTDLLLLAASYWTLGTASAASEPIAGQSRMGHACAWETSMMLRTAPQLVQDPSAVEPVPLDGSFEPASRAWTTIERSRVGHIGDPRHASAEHGERLLSRFAADVVALLERVAAWDGRSWDG